MSKELRLTKLVVTFTREGIEYDVSYAHSGAEGGIPSPGSKRRTTTAVRLASVDLQVGLEGLDKGGAVSTGFATDTIESTDTIVVDSVDQRTSRRASA